MENMFCNVQYARDLNKLLLFYKTLDTKISVNDVKNIQDYYVSFSINKIDLTNETSIPPDIKFQELPLQIISKNEILSLRSDILKETKLYGKFIILHNSINLPLEVDIRIFDLIRYNKLPEDEFVLVGKGNLPYEGGCHMLSYFDEEGKIQAKYFYHPEFSSYCKRFKIKE